MDAAGARDVFCGVLVALAVAAGERAGGIGTAG